VTDPLALLPLAAASRRGSIDDIPASALVAAGLTLLQRSAPLVRALAGRRAGILLPTSPAFLVALAASEGRGAVLMNPLAAPRELAYQITDAGIGAVLTIAALADRLPPDVPHVLLDDAPRTATVIAAGTTRTVDLGSHFALELEGDADAPGSPEEAAVVYTSAMAGRPLGAILTHRGLLASARGTIDVCGITADDRVLAALPFSHLFGLVATAISPLLAGASVTTLSRFRASSAIDLLEGGITTFVGVPAMFIALLAAIERRGTPFRAGALRLCVSGGAPLDEAVQERWLEATGIELRQGYGLTEASPVALVNRFGAPNAPGTLGTPFPGVELSIRDVASFAPLADGETGEICVRGEIVFAGYVRGPGAAAPAGLEVRDGWLRTGDLGLRRPDGVFVFRGLTKAMFTRNGFNIYPREIEAAVRELPGVAAAAVRAVPDPAHENDIALDVTGSAGQEQIRAWCEERLSAYKQPATITVAAAR
jgi:long-chain acyl-CoA synthetase